MGYLWEQKELALAPLVPQKKIPETGPLKTKKIIQVWNQYGGLLQKVSDILKLDPGVSIAIICVESSGVGFQNGKMIIRFEPHWFHKLWGKNNTTKFAEHFQFKSWRGQTHFFRANAKCAWEKFHGNQGKEWQAFEVARQLDETAAMKSISMGLGQVMGFNHSGVGYSSVQKMFENFGKDVRYQLLGIFDFMTEPMKNALRKKFFVTFAKYYNGSGQASQYGGLIGEYVKAWEANVKNKTKSGLSAKAAMGVE